MTSSPAPTIHIAQSLLARAHSPDTASQQFTERIKQKPLFLRPTSPSASDNRSRRRLHRLRKKNISSDTNGRALYPRARSARQASTISLKKNEILDLKTDGRSGLVTPASHGAKLVSADYHGAEVEVVRSRSAGRVGLKGFVVRDTKFTFVIVTEKDQVKTIPKEHSIFRFTVPFPKSAKLTDGEQQGKTEDPKPLEFELHGSQFENRPVDRANKKFKWRNVDYL
ncbi:RNA polymerase Rpb8 [Penicillium atrosanguineum]|uniref:RNA polymerase Rpb8 n=1 Tax=Penicillium atrosanguineum TaxID=1132637 RepID=UPI002396D9BA|nr:RNA polymerase Rpb8 [Penicillium atrosanguineum]KAJ5313569.1 RNA polymerase Rpb8 [Penicillium atrosanguineum]